MKAPWGGKGTPATAPDGSMSLLAHLVELRTRLVRVAIAISIGAVLGWLLYNPVLHFLTAPLRQLSQNSSAAKTLFPNGDLLATSPLEPFAIRLKVSLYLGIAVAMPVILWQIWRFIAPGLYANERKYALSFVLSALTLFILGALTAYYTLGPTLQFLGSIGGPTIINGYSPGKYLQLITYMMLIFGAGFEFPIVLVFLQLAGVVTTRQLITFRRWAYVGICIVCAVITPSSDPISMIALMIPMWIFYEVAIVFGRIRDRRLRRAAAKATAATGS